MDKEKKEKASPFQIIIGYLFIALSVIVVLSVISFNPMDSSLFVSEVSYPVSNIAGRLGAFLSSWLVLIYGKYAAYMMSFAFFAVGINLLVNVKIGRVLLKLGLFIMTVISIAVLISIIITDPTYIEGGLIGTLVAQSLLELIPHFILIPIFGLIILLALSGSMKLFRKLTNFLAKGVGYVLFWPVILFKKSRHQTEPPTDLELEEEYQPNNKQRSQFENNLMENSSVTNLTNEYEKNVEMNRLSESTKEPDFLNSLSDSENDDTHNISFDFPDTAPGWLIGDDVRHVLDDIEHFYDRMIYQSSLDIETSENENELRTTQDVVKSDSLPTEPKLNKSSYSPESEVGKNEERGVDIETLHQEMDMAGNEREVINEMQPVSSELEKQESEKNEIEEFPQSPLLDEEARAILEFDEEEAKVQPETDETPLEQTESVSYTQPKYDEELEPANQSSYIYPKTELLDRSYERFTREEEQTEVNRKTNVIENTFESFKIEIKVDGFSRGPAITRYELIPPEGLKLKSIVNLTDDLALKLGTKNIRIVAPIGHKSMIGVEVPNRYRKTIVLRDIIESDIFQESNDILPLILGMDLTGNIIIKDLAQMPHLLIAGTTGSGKSVYVNSLIAGLVFKLTQDELKFIMIDPKMVELELYNGIPHLLCPIITQPEEALAALEWAVREMDRRYKMLSEFSVRNVVDYNDEVKKINRTRRKNNEAVIEELPFIVIVIDEFANLMLRSPKETEKVISRIAAMARAVGIHLVIATQRPSVDVVTGIIKANFPSRIAFRVISKTDSRTILDENGAESLLDKGDMLFRIPSQRDMMRIQSPFVSNRDVENIVKELKQNGKPDYLIDLDDLMDNTVSNSDPDKLTDYTSDELYPDVLKEAVGNGEISASYIQRKFRVGFNRASRLMEALDQLGILAASEGSSKPRKVLISQEDLVHYL